MDPARPPQESAELKLIRAAENQEFSGSSRVYDETIVASSSLTNSVPVHPDVISGYEVLREIHRGGQGVVYQAVQKATGRKVAIKVMKEGPFADQRDIARFEREVQILGQLDHPNIVNVRDSGNAAGSFYFVMDYIPGHPLDQALGDGQREIERVIRLFTEVCAAVNAAHLLGVIHRDLKPSNILVSPDGRPHVLDFGLAKTVTQDSDAPTVMTITGQFVGSLPWASPEQADEGTARVDIRSDVYSLGVILFQMLTRRFPYEVSGNMRDVVANIVSTAPARPRLIRRDIDDELETIVLKALSKERERRYQSAGELGRDLERYLAGQPVEAKRDSHWYLLRKSLRRFRIHVAVATAFLTLIAAFGVWMAVMYQRTDELYQRTDELRMTAEQINDFLVEDLLGSAKPEVAPGREVTVREVLQKASERVDGAFPDQPLIEGRLRLTLGQCYVGLGLFDEAAPHLERGLMLQSSTSGEKHARTVEAALALAELYNRQGRFADAETLYTSSADILSETHGPNDHNTLDALSNLALVYRYQGRIDEAEPLLQRVIEAGEATTLHSTTTTRWKHKLAAIYVDQGRDDDAETLYLQVIDTYKRVFDDESHPDLLVAINDLAGLYGRQEHYELARPLLEKVLVSQRDVLGTDHSRTIATMVNLGTLYRRIGSPHLGEPLLEEALDLRLSTLGATHPSTLNAIFTMGLHHDEVGQFEKAEPLYRQAFNGRRSKLGPTHRLTLISMSKLGETYVALGRLEDGEPLLMEAVSGARGTLPPDHKYHGLFLRPLGECYTRQGRHAEAEATLTESFDLVRAAFGSNHMRTQKVRDSLVRLYKKWERPEDAAQWEDDE
jgi:serine/threonine protein kinase